MGKMLLLSFTLILFVIIVVCYFNRDRIRLAGKKPGKPVATQTEEPTDGHLTPDEVWDMVIADYDTGEETVIPQGETTTNVGLDGGVKTTVTKKDGSVEAYTVSERVAVNEHPLEQLDFSGKVPAWMVEDTDVAYHGLLIDKSQGIVDYNRLKKEKIDFVFIHLGDRGALSGSLTTDDYFAKNMLGASNAGLKIGVTFHGAATNEEEALEEAEYVLTLLKDYSISYPIVYEVSVPEDNDRNASLKPVMNTKIACAFLNRIKEAGYIAMYGGSKEMLITRMDVNFLDDYEILLIEQMEEPEYPYRLAMWQYGDTVHYKGLTYPAAAIISFIDYSVK